MATQSEAPVVAAGEHGEPCAACGAPLAADQRYCLECGERRARLRPPAMPTAASAPPAPPAALPSRLQGLPPGSGLIGGIAVLLLALGVGVLIGKAGKGGGGSAAAPSVITVAQPGGSAPAAQSATGAAFQGDWPAGRDAWTVQLQRLPKASTQPAAVAAAKSAAQGKGAKGVGALDEDSYSSLAGGSYLVYSGDYASRAQAAKALKGLKAKFPGAKVVHVSNGGGGSASKATAPKKTVSKQQLKKLDNLSPQQYQKQSKSLPKTLGTPGAPPPKDKKAPGGGSGSTSIG
jgi:hypothetical protein